jgi:hypothetical protein
MYLRCGMILVIDTSVDSHDREGSLLRVSIRTKASHERCQIRLACKLLQVAHNPELVFPRRSRLIFFRAIQLAQYRRRHHVRRLGRGRGAGDRRCRHMEWLRGTFEKGRTVRRQPQILPESARRAEVCRRRNSLYVFMQGSGEGVANRANNDLVCLNVAIELIRCAEEGICLGQRDFRDCEPTAAVGD